jgi:hypothetical protein
MWTQAEAIELCVALEAIAPTYGCHVALTGGLLYKTGPRKDCDVLFYRIRQTTIAWDNLWKALEMIGLTKIKGKKNHWCIKADWFGKSVDCFFPEAPAGDSYPS